METEDIFEFLSTIAEEDKPLPIEGLDTISDMSREEHAAFLDVWSNLGAPRRRELVQLLGQQADERIELNFELINRTGLQDDDQAVRQTAILNLWECEDPDLAVIYLESLRNDSSDDVRIAAANALGRYVLLGELEEISADLLHDIEDELLTIMDSEKFSLLQQTCVEALGYSSRTESEEVIERAYQAEDPDTKRSAIIAMGRSYNPRWETQVMVEMLSPYPELRAEAARAAGELELRGAVDSLIELLEDVHKDVQKTAIWSLGQIGGDRAEEALLAAQEIIEEESLLGPIDDALDHLAFLKGSPDFALLDYEGPDVE